MAQTYFPFDSGSGGSVTEAQWGQMAQFWLSTGIIKGQLNQLNPFADSTGMQVKVDTGMAWIQGYFYKNDSTIVTLPIATAPTSNSRIDRIILRVDWTLNTIVLAILQGASSASPTPPALTQNTAIWEISLAQVLVGTNVSTIAAGNITDERTFTGNVVSQINNLDTRSYAMVNSGTATNYATANAWQQIPFASSECVLSSDVLYAPSNCLTANTDGTYFIRAEIELSGLNTGVFGNLLIRVTPPAGRGAVYDFTINRQGATGYGGNNGGVWIATAKVDKLYAGSLIYFMANVGEAPRTIMHLRAQVFKISKFTVGVS
jgi:hypothetical protein